MKAIDDLVQSFAKLPGLGPKSAARLVNYIIKADSAYVEEFAQRLGSIQSKIRPCSVCGAWSETEVCPVCADTTRDKSVICVVEKTEDVDTLKSIPGFRGTFHVLGGAINPVEGVQSASLNIPHLLKRIEQDDVKELVFATSPTFEGDATALYIQKLIQDKGWDIKITKLATGIPIGSSFEFLDKITLQRSYSARTQM